MSIDFVSLNFDHPFSQDAVGVSSSHFDHESNKEIKFAIVLIIMDIRLINLCTVESRFKKES